jgi:hypothetical protein
VLRVVDRICRSTAHKAANRRSSVVPRRIVRAAQAGSATPGTAVMRDRDLLLVANAIGDACSGCVSRSFVEAHAGR